MTKFCHKRNKRWMLPPMTKEWKTFKLASILYTRRQFYMRYICRLNQLTWYALNCHRKWNREFGICVSDEVQMAITKVTSFSIYRLEIIFLIKFMQIEVDIKIALKSLTAQWLVQLDETTRIPTAAVLLLCSTPVCSVGKKFKDIGSTDILLYA